MTTSGTRRNSFPCLVSLVRSFETQWKMISSKRGENKDKMDSWEGRRKVPNGWEQKVRFRSYKPCPTLLCVVLNIISQPSTLKSWVYTGSEHRISWNQILVWMNPAQRHVIRWGHLILFPSYTAAERKENGQQVCYDGPPLAKLNTKEMAKMVTNCSRDHLPQKVSLVLQTINIKHQL